MKKRTGAMLGLAVFAALALSACGGGKSASYADGTYEGKSELFINDDPDAEDEEAGNGYGVVQITVKDNQIVDCTFKTYDPDGNLKDENYGMKSGSVANRDYYNKAQKAVAACDEYASELAQSGSLDGIDAISGATINFNEFTEAVENALEQAKTQ